MDDPSSSTPSASTPRAARSSVDLAADPAVDPVPGLEPDLGPSVLARLAAVAAAAPGALAVTSHGQRLSYGELCSAALALAEQLTAHLEQLGADAPAADGAVAPIAVLADQGVPTVVASFAVMAAGRPVVVLDPLLPAERLSLLATMSGARLLLVGDDATGAAADVVAASTIPLDVLPLRPADGLAGRDAAADTAALAELGAAGDDLAPASILFTSGSTGQPKGVVLTHRTVLAGAHISRERLHLVAQDAVALVLPHAFAAGQEVAFMALLTGASLHAHDPRTRGMREVPAWVVSEGITTLHGTPSLVRAVVGGLRPGQVLDRVRLVTTCGEAAYGRDVTAVRAHLRPDAVVTTFLGSSETGQLAFLELGPGAVVPDGALPAGTPAPLKQISVLGPDGSELPTGEVGAVTITSAHLSGGYWRDPARTVERFRPAPDGRTRYATGDRGWFDDDGVLHLAGRADDAVKVRGYLVEPADVEAALLALEGVAQVVVRGRRPGAAARGSAAETAPVQLVGWVVPDPRVGVPSLASLRKAARASLPAWMVPSAIVLVTELPLTERGKLDAARLPDPPPRREPRAPSTDAQARMGAIWASVLDLEGVDPDETFSELGGDSLAVEEALARVREQFGASLQLKDLAEHPTLAGFTDLAVAAARRRRERSPLAPSTVRFRGSGTGLPVFCFAGNAGHAAAFAELAAALGPEHAVHGFQVNGLTNRGALDWTMAANARRHLRDVEAVAPEGPVVLVGHSLGGLFALEAARQLAARGREVPLVVLVDTFLPPRHGGHVGTWESVATGGGDHDADEPGSAAPSAQPFSPWRLVLRQLRGREARVLRHRLLLLGAGPLTYSPETTEHVMWQHGLWLARTARVHPWSGRTLLFTSEENRDPISRWDDLLIGPHEVVPVAGDHSGLLKPPYLPQVLRPVLRAIAEVTPPA